MRDAALELFPAMGSWRAFYSIAETLDFTLREMEASVKVEPDGGRVSTGLGTCTAMMRRAPSQYVA